MTVATVTSGTLYQIGSQWAAQRIRQTSPSPTKPTSGVVQRARHQPGAVKRWIPVGGGGGAWWPWPFGRRAWVRCVSVIVCFLRYFVFAAR